MFHPRPVGNGAHLSRLTESVEMFGTFALPRAAGVTFAEEAIMLTLRIDGVEIPVDGYVAVMRAVRRSRPCAGPRQRRGLNLDQVTAEIAAGLYVSLGGLRDYVEG